MFEMLTREEYLARRHDWRQEYKELSADIKALKAARRLAAKAAYAATLVVEEKKDAVARRLQSLCAVMGNQAHQMMDDLDVLKENCRMSVAFERFMEQRNAQ